MYITNYMHIYVFTSFPFHTLHTHTLAHTHLHACTHARTHACERERERERDGDKGRESVCMICVCGGGGGGQFKLLLVTSGAYLFQETKSTESIAFLTCTMILAV